MDNPHSGNEEEKADGPKTDPIAIASFSCVIAFLLSVGFCILIAESGEAAESGRSKVIGASMALGLALLSALLSVLLGITAFFTILFSGGRRKGYRWAAVGPALFVGFPVAWNFVNQTTPGRKVTCSSQKTRLQKDFVRIGMTLDAYTLDLGECPPASNMDLRVLQDILRNRRGELACSKFPNLVQAKERGWFEGFPGDPFMSHRTLRYHAWQNKGWILWSGGPDRDYDLHEGNIAAVLGAAQDRLTTESLVPITYDATNGTLSSGDIWFRGEDYRLRTQNPASLPGNTNAGTHEFPR